jgi:hypothetical protein
MVEVGRLELHVAHLLPTRSGACRVGELQFRCAVGDRCCPLLSAVHPSDADPVRTDEGSSPPPAADTSDAAVLGDQDGNGQGKAIKAIHTSPVVLDEAS